MKELIKKAPKIIKEAGRSPLGLAAEVVLLLSFVALMFFSRGSEIGRLISFLALLTGLTLFALAVVLISSNSDTSEMKGNASQAAAICYRRRGEHLEFLLILNKDRTKRIFPKGNVKEDESLWAAAEREAKKEAGIKEYRIDKKKFTLFWIRKGKKRPQEISTAAYLIEVTRRTSEHESKRDPQWYNTQDALNALEENRERKVYSELQRVIRKASSHLSEQ